MLALVVAVAAKAQPPSPAVQRFWDRVQRCEEPTTGWHTRGSTYSGGVGFYNGTWTYWASALGLARRYPNAADAPRLVQITVAEYGYQHRGYWGCIHSGVAGRHP